MIIQSLHARQDARGYLNADDLRAVAEELAVPLHRIQSLVSFYPHFRTTPPAQVEVQVCRDMACHLRGSKHLCRDLSDWANDKGDGEVKVAGVSCLGRCDRAPAMLVNDQLYVARNQSESKQIIESHLTGVPVECDTDAHRALLHSNDWSIEPYDGERNYRAVTEFLADPEPAIVLSALERAGLLGMGGAGGRAYLKWSDVAKAVGTAKYVVCNADESEPGTFKDRELLLAKPHLIIEGMILGALTVGAEQGWVYVRHEYPEQITAIRMEIERATELGVLGRNIQGSGRTFEIDVFISPGGYICGEQTALIEAMENKRAEPRNRPPELMTNGYLNQPTLLNNVETFAWVPAIMLREQGQWFADQGIKAGPLVGEASSRMRGRRLFSISGDVARPGVVEVPTGTTLGSIIEEKCGGMARGKELVAIALSGPSGGLLPPMIPVEFLNENFVQQHVPTGTTHLDVLDLPLDINVSRAVGLMVGAGIVVYGTGADIVAEAVACSQFFRNETCGKCVPCRIGSQKITEFGEQLDAGEISPTQLPVLEESAHELASVMTATSICGLGQVASNPVRTLLSLFPDAVAERIGRARSPDSRVATEGSDE